MTNLTVTTIVADAAGRLDDVTATILEMAGADIVEGAYAAALVNEAIASEGLIEIINSNWGRANGFLRGAS